MNPAKTNFIRNCTVNNGFEFCVLYTVADVKMLRTLEHGAVSLSQGFLVHGLAAAGAYVC